MKIGIVIPAYNSEAYINKAIESVLKQTHKDWVCIVVDDCSTDNTVSVVESYKDDRIKVVKSEVNKGAGVARQIGNRELEKYDVDFVTYIDSDDYITEDYLEKSIELQQQHNSDIVYTSFIVEAPNAEHKIIPAGDFIMEKGATVQLYYWNKIKFLTGKLIRFSLVKRVKWSDNRVGEDCQTFYSLLFFADKVRSSSYGGYVHIFREGSLLANKPFDYCACWSSLAQCDIVEFLRDNKGKKDEGERMFDFEVNNLKKQFNDMLGISVAVENRELYWDTLLRINDLLKSIK